MQHNNFSRQSSDFDYILVDYIIISTNNPFHFDRMSEYITSFSFEN
jgi:hypothetical protein